MHIEVAPRRKHTISLTPLIDVVFILLVFFMLASSLTDWRQVALATGTDDSSSDRRPAVVAVQPNGALRYQDEAYTAAELAPVLRDAADAGDIEGVVVRPQPETELGPTVAALDALAGAGLKAVTLGRSGG